MVGHGLANILSRRVADSKSLAPVAPGVTKLQVAPVVRNISFRVRATAKLSVWAASFAPDALRQSSRV
jgi:hypothetical protein